MRPLPGLCCVLLLLVASARTSYSASCADDCTGEEEIVAALKAGMQTPKCCSDLIYETTTYVDNLLTKNNITYWAMKGTLLGVLREKGIIPHDYDIDIGMLYRDINRVAGLRSQIWKDGYVLFQAPWTGYNNMNFVIARRTKTLATLFKEKGLKATSHPVWDKATREQLVAAELMVFAPYKVGNTPMLVQVLCTWPDKKNKDLYTGKLSPSIPQEVEEDTTSYNKRKATEKNGWLKYANSLDRPWASYETKFDGDHRSKFCEHTAPASFRYDTPEAWVLPTTRLPYFSTTLSVPAASKDYAKNYFGKDYMTPKRRYGKGKKKKSKKLFFF